MKIIMISIWMIMASNFIGGQDISEHRWENRLLLVLAQNADVPALEAQMAEIEKDPAGWAERKLLVYVVLPDRYTVRRAENGFCGGQWVTSSVLYEQFAKKSAPFGVALIGLDGGIKVRKSEVFTQQALFGVIDGMPMRRGELRDGE